jgi:FKBP-type peptidyl-prolyl cis-trans isomerase FkpA
MVVGWGDGVGGVWVHISEPWYKWPLLAPPRLASDARTRQNAGMTSAFLRLTVAASVAILLSASPSLARKREEIPLPLKQIVPEKVRVCAQKTASGLGYRVLRAGTGAKPGKRDVPMISYIGYLAKTGEVFDQNVNVAMPVGGVIQGFAEGLQLIPQGGITRLCIPSRLGYGEEGGGPIPPNADLVFQVEILKASRAAE